LYLVLSCFDFLAQLPELLKSAGQNAVCRCVCVC